MTSNRLWIYAAFIASLAVIMAQGDMRVKADSTDVMHGRTLSLSAVGSVKTRPDTAHISIGVVSEAETARSALDANTASMTNVVAELKAKDVAERDIQTTNFAVHPQYQHFKDGRPSVISGYRVINSVSITVRDISRLGEVLDTVVTLGSNQIGGIGFSVSEPAQLMDDARRAAMEDARRKAELYVEAAQVGLGRVLKLQEETADQGPRVMFRARAEAISADVPIEAGETELQVRITVVWELIDRS
jgi:uncharacterized protein YggE